MKRASSLLLMLFLLVSCSEPDFYRYYITREDSGNDTYSFEFKLDSLGSYDISFFSRVSAIDGTLASSIPFDVNWTMDGDSLVLSERVWFVVPAKGETVHMYRRGIEASQNRDCKLCVHIPEYGEALSGLGITVQKH